MPGVGGGSGRRLRQLAAIDVDVLRGVGPARRRALGALGIDTILDLLTHYPHRYLDQTRQVRIADLAVDEAAWVVAEVTACRVVGVAAGRAGPRAGRGGGRVEVTVADGSGTLRVTFFNQRFRAKQLPVGTRALFYGRLQMFRGQRQFANPDVDLLGDRAGRIVPLYPASDRAGIASWQIAGLVEEALERAGSFADPIPPSWRQRLGLVDRTAAFGAIHRPEDLAQIPPARRRLAFDELLRLQLDGLRRRRQVEEMATGIRHQVDVEPGRSDLLGRFVDGLPFPLTGAQRRAIERIRCDMAGPRPMHRLLQGDVGSGKTVVAAAALVVAVQGGHQGALLAPTEVVAEQHHLGLREMLGSLTVDDPAALGGQRPVRVALLTGRVPAAARRRLLADLAAGQVDIAVGTHALLSEDVHFATLGVVVVDEQHRFGVEQRAVLRTRTEASGGATPDLLVMTATPIPRTAAMAVLGDLDVTELDELPAGRAPISTVWARTAAEGEEAWARVRHEVEAGHRAYVICPLVEASDRVEVAAATDEYQRLAAGPLAGVPVGLLHGQMPAAAKEEAMAGFRSGTVPVLVATTVVEVGVDVPEATVVVIEDAGRFGIAQLHQLRGRVGRSTLPSWCYLLDGGAGPDVDRRLQALVDSTDGFVLAEVDLELRGEGTLFGTRQRGRSDLKLATLRRRDRHLVRQARELAVDLLAGDDDLACHRLLADELDLFLGAPEAAFLAKS